MLNYYWPQLNYSFRSDFQGLENRILFRPAFKDCRDPEWMSVQPATEPSRFSYNLKVDVGSQVTAHSSLWARQEQTSMHERERGLWRTEKVPHPAPSTSRPLTTDFAVQQSTGHNPFPVTLLLVFDDSHQQCSHTNCRTSFHTTCGVSWRPLFNISIATRTVWFPVMLLVAFREGRY